MAAINKKLIHFREKQDFNGAIATNSILDTSIVFIQDSQEIHTHGTTYKTVNWTVLEDGGSITPNLITFIINNPFYQDDTTNYEAEKGMTWGEWVVSKYNTANYYISYGSVHHFQGYSVSDGNAYLVKETDVINENHVYETSRVGSDRPD